MLFMVIERFKPGATKEIYERLEQHGRMLPMGTKYIDSWVSIESECCFQLMEAEKITLFKPWIEKWSDLVDFEIMPVVDSKKAASIATRAKN